MIGKQKHPFSMIIDTDSPVTWVPSQNCQNCKDEGLYKLYDCGQSMTCSFINEQLQNLQLLNYQLDGQLIQEKITFNNIDETSLNISIILVQNLNNYRDIFKGQGVLGLGSVKILQQLKDLGLIEKKMFSLYFSNQQCQGNSLMTLGGFNENLIDGNIVYFDIPKSINNNTHFWILPLKDISLSGQTSMGLQKMNRTVRISSGSNVINLPKYETSVFIQLFLQNFNIQCYLEKTDTDQNYFDIVCEESQNYPDIRIMIGESEFILQPDDYLNLCYIRVVNKVCKLKITQSQEDIVVLGDLFIRKYYTIFNFDDRKIGFGVAKRINDENLIQNNLIIVYLCILIIISLAIIFVVICHFYIQRLEINEVGYEKKDHDQINSQPLSTENYDRQTEKIKIEMPSIQTDINFDDNVIHSSSNTSNRESQVLNSGKKNNYDQISCQQNNNTSQNKNEIQQDEPNSSQNQD